MKHVNIMLFSASACSRRWKILVIGFIYYLTCVIILGNVMLFFYWQSSKFADQNDNSARENSVYLDETVNLNNNVVFPEGSTTTSLTSTVSKANDDLEFERNFYRKRETKVNPYLYSFVVTPKLLCNDVVRQEDLNETGARTSENMFMIILVHSWHSYTDRRMAIRETWGSVAKGAPWPDRNHTKAKTVASGFIRERMKLVFILGMHTDPGLNDLVLEEAESYDDIVVGNFRDTYRNMTLKSLLGLKLVSERCQGVQYMLKSDDDMFINMPYLMRILKATEYRRTFMGPYNVGSKVYRNGKWRLSKEEFPFFYFPPYESGSAYIITGDVTRELFETSEYVPPIFIDDVYITGILGKILNVTHVRRDGFAFWINRVSKVCDFIENKMVTGTKMTPALLRQTWKGLGDANITCVKNLPKDQPDWVELIGRT